MGDKITGTFGFSDTKQKQMPVPFAQRGDPNIDLLFNRDETRSFLNPIFSALPGFAGQAGQGIDISGLNNLINNRDFAPSRNQNNLIRETIDQINSNVAVRTGGPPTSGTIGRAIGGQLANLDQQDIQNNIQSQGLSQQLLALALQAALGIGRINDPARLLRLANVTNTDQTGFNAGLESTGFSDKFLSAFAGG